MRRSRRNGQLRRTSSIRRGSHSDHQNLFSYLEASAITWPNGSATNDRPRTPGRSPAALRIRRDSPPPRKSHWRWHARAEWSARRRVAPRRTSLSRRDASRSPWDRTTSAPRPVPRAARLPDTTDPSRPACRFGRSEYRNAEAQVARSEIKFLEIERIVRDVHLAVDAEHAAVGIEDRGRVVIHARGAPLEKRARRSTTSSSLASPQSASWTVPESARPRSNNSAFSSRQKYCERNSSCKQMICAPLPAASRMARLWLSPGFHRDPLCSTSAPGRCETFRA